MKQHDNHVAAYYFRKSALADRAKSDAYEAERARRYVEGLPLSRIRMSDYDKAPTDPHHGGKIWNP